VRAHVAMNGAEGSISPVSVSMTKVTSTISFIASPLCASHGCASRDRVVLGTLLL
jgi:hypothetical protein